MSEPGKDNPSEAAKLGLWDAVSIIVGIVIGSSIFKTPPIIFSNVTGAWEGMGVWLLGGVLSLVGALCYAELATTYPRSGGDYVYLTRAFGRQVGFLFGWAQLVVVLSGSTAMMAFIFGEYAADLFTVPTEIRTAFAVEWAGGSVIVIALLNFFGLVLGKWVQNLLVVLKLAGMAGIVFAGLVWGNSEGWSGGLPVDQGFGVALILVLYAYGGWNDAAFVAADLRDRRHIARALIISTIGITLIYLAVNAAFIWSLGFAKSRSRPTIASDVVKPIGALGSKGISLLVMISALGAMNGLIFTGSRVYSTMGSEHHVFALLGRWHPRFHTPVWSLFIQALIAFFMILMVGTEKGQNTINRILALIDLKIPWKTYFGGFDTLFAGTAPVFWVFFLLTGVSFFVLRYKDPGISRPFRLRTPWYPLLPLIFCGTCLFGFYRAIIYAEFVSLIGWVPLLLGWPLFFLSRQTSGEQP